MACVGLATYAQNLTGFAFSLILLGLVSVFDIASVNDAANAATVLSLINAWTYFRARPGPVPWQLMKPALNGSTVGVIVGLMLLVWLSGSAVSWLRGLLGVSILICAVLLLLQGKPLPAVSGRTSFALIGGLSGVLGGLFSTLFFAVREKSSECVFGVVYSYYVTLFVSWVWPYALLTSHKSVWMTRVAASPGQSTGRAVTHPSIPLFSRPTASGVAVAHVTRELQPAVAVAS